MAKTKKNEAYDKSHKIMKLHLVMTIVDRGVGWSVVYLIQKYGIPSHFIQRGEGTATKDVIDLLALKDSDRDVIYSMVPDNKLDDVMKDLDGFLSQGKRRAGISFAVPFESIAGRTAYHFMTLTVE